VDELKYMVSVYEDFSSLRLTNPVFIVPDCDGCFESITGYTVYQGGTSIFIPSKYIVVCTEVVNSGTDSNMTLN
jgi:hypothetical protein